LAFFPMLLISENLCSQDEDFGYQKLGLTHHLSLPSSSTRMAATMEKLYQTQGNVPCKIRAKRGFATHPRSIAERVKVYWYTRLRKSYARLPSADLLHVFILMCMFQERRTRISARIKKLQDLFPDKVN